MIRQVGLIIVAAGASRRMGQVDKIWASLGDRPVLWHSVATFYRSAVETVVVVAEDSVRKAEETLLPAFPGLQVIKGGAERQDSVALGLEVLPDVEVIAVHDGARPMADLSLLTRGVDSLKDWAGAVPGIPLRDTLKQVNASGEVTGTLNRSELQAVQTPQSFRASVLREAYRQAEVKALRGTDDATLVERIGEGVVVFPGLERNFKVTTPYDLHLARLLMGGGRAQ